MTSKRSWIYDLLLIAVLALAAYLRVTGVEWGEGYHQHPDELFLTGVVENLRAHSCMDEGTPIEACSPERQRWMTIGEYFDTANSTLNPRNRGAGFYVYGNLPVTLVRVAYEAIGPEAGPMKFFGRQFSALADLFTILILYFIVARVYNQKTALLAALFSALAVMQIQQSHFFTVDLFVNPFMFAALYFAVRIAYDGKQVDTYTGTQVDEDTQYAVSRSIPVGRSTPYYVLRNIWREPLFWHSLLFGLFLGLAAASKINAVVMAVALPVALALRFSNQPTVISDHASRSVNSDQSTDTQHAIRNTRYPISNYYLPITIYLLLGGLATLLTFRVFQPYAFDTIFPNEQWIANMKEIQAQATGLADTYWNLQWARRTHLYSFTNLTVWGLGLPLSLLAWTGFLVMGWRVFKNRETRHILLWSWTALYFAWQSLQFNATMRYQLPIYPLLAMMAAWVVFNVERSTLNVKRLTFTIGSIVLVLTAIWAFAFLKVYTRPETRIEASRWIFKNIPGPITLRFQDGISQPLPFPSDGIILGDAPYLTSFTARQDGTLTEIHFPHALSNLAASQTLTVSLLDAANSASPLATASIEDTFAPAKDTRGNPFTLKLSQPIPLAQGQSFLLRVETTGALTLAGAGIANETDYDWNLPFNVDGYDAFGGIYRGDLNLQVYWDDNADKLARLTNSLNQTDYIFIPTNHQYGQITRIPERYPLTTLYYRELVGCPPEEDIIWCYRVAEPGTFEGRLGFDLVKTFTSYPTLGPIVINDGAAEEAFTFYDHPKVLIFKKNANYDATKVAATLGSVDLTKVVRLTPKEAGNYKPPKSTMLPADRLATQQAGGTWSELFDYEKLQNKIPVVGAIGWYAFIFWIGLISYPLARRALPGLADKGYALSRTLGLVIFAYAAWALGSLGVPVSRGLLGIIFGAMTLIGAWQAWVQRDALASEWKSNRRWFVIVELLFLALFVLDLAIRLGNPDLWHPYKGGERPMDFSYFNAVIKSATFPPYDPWFAGGYINYYYYGFVLVGMPVKFLGVVPSIAYNFILPTLFALVGIGAFTVGYNLVHGTKAHTEHATRNTQYATLITDNWSLITGFAATSFTLLLGNLGTIQMLIRAFQRLGAPGQVVDASAGFFQRFSWGLDGFAKSLAGEALPLGRGDWYWLPSRVIPAPGDVEPITEFPLFTFLYSDLHAHMIVLMLALFMIAWGLSIVLFLRRAGTQVDTEHASPISYLLSCIAPPIILGALVLGAIYPTNTWDAYTYLPLSALALGYALFNAFDFKDNRFNLPPYILRLTLSIAGTLALVLLAFLFYQPYFQWWGSGYNSVARWMGGHTPLSSYFTHWGVFLFILFAWMAWETREWMAATPLSSLGKLKPYQLLIELVLAAFFVVLFYLLYRKAVISLVALPMAFWAAILLLRPGQQDAKRWVLFMVGTSLALTIAVELIVVVGDVGRMNTVFKLYLQAWTMLSVSAAAALGWTFPAVPSWKMRWRGVWQVGLTVLLAGAAFFTVSATMDKVRDRMNLTAPHTLDSMTFMATTTYWDSVDINLGQDYGGIRWLQDHAQGSPVIVEANCIEYRWCTRYTIYTGLPGVVGWNWHQRQQRGFVQPLIIENRIGEIMAFYTATDPNAALAFLKKYNVRYIIVGQVEAIYYPGEGLLKFETYDGQLWKEVFRDGSTVIYEVQ
ncbi:MAG: glycosyltransferase family 39 protein [Chloroflexi bacterium]|nr:glycosyltransferase family 39 protein [Chloroflexota bacterium]